MSPQPGDYFTVRTGGWVAHVIRMATESSHANHAGIFLGDGEVIEAEPHGAKIGPASRYLTRAHWSTAPLTDEQRAAIVREARKLEGAKYGYVDIAVLGLVHVFGWKCPAWVRRYLQRSDRLICSQLVDLAYCRAGVHLFDDGRVPAEVTPGDLYDL
jgi:cell wall-associated NlpC family hydrolase